MWLQGMGLAMAEGTTGQRGGYLAAGGFNKESTEWKLISCAMKEPLTDGIRFGIWIGSALVGSMAGSLQFCCRRISMACAKSPLVLCNTILWLSEGIRGKS